MHRSLICIAMLILIACGEEPASSLDGTWGGSLGMFSNFRLSLAESGVNVTGNGTWCGATVACASFTVGGTYLRPNVDLVLTYSDGSTGRYSARVEGDRVMSGTWTDNRGSDAVSFGRQ